MFDNLTFDTIYHEHLSYLAVRPLARLFKEHGLEIFDVRTYPVQGLSLRVYAGFPGMHKVSPSVQEFLEDEKKRGLDTFQTYQNLAKKIIALKDDVVKHLRNLKEQGKRVVGYGAPAKGNTLLNYYGIGTDLLECLTDGLPSKIGRYAPGTHIPVVDRRVIESNPPDAYFLLAWNYKDSILEKEKDFRIRGGMFIMPIGHQREV